MAEALAASFGPARGRITRSGSTARSSSRPRRRSRSTATSYLPRKFKTAVGLSTDNCVDIYSQDVGLLAIVRDGRIAGLQPAGRRRPRHDPQQGRHHRAPGPAARLRADGARGGGGAPRRRDLPRPRQPLRPAARPAQVPARRVGHRPLPRGVPAPGVVPAGSRRSRSRRCRSTTTSAATASRDGRWFYGVFIQSGRIVDTAGPRAQDRAARDRHPASARHPAHRRSRTCCSPISSQQPGQVERILRRARRHPPARALRRAALLDGLPRPPHLRAGGGRIGAGDSRRSSTSSRRSSKVSACATRRSPSA